MQTEVNYFRVQSPRIEELVIDFLLKRTEAETIYESEDASPSYMAAAAKMKAAYQAVFTEIDILEFVNIVPGRRRHLIRIDRLCGQCCIAVPEPMMVRKREGLCRMSKEAYSELRLQNQQSREATAEAMGQPLQARA